MLETIQGNKIYSSLSEYKTLDELIDAARNVYIFECIVYLDCI